MQICNISSIIPHLLIFFGYLFLIDSLLITIHDQCLPSLSIQSQSLMCYLTSTIIQQINNTKRLQTGFLSLCSIRLLNLPYVFPQRFTALQSNIRRCLRTYIQRNCSLFPGICHGQAHSHLIFSLLCQSPKSLTDCLVHEQTYNTGTSSLRQQIFQFSRILHILTNLL